MTTSYITAPDANTPMQIEVFTEGSGTTADQDDVKSVVDFFKGGFLPVKDLVTDLDEYGDLTIHILSNQYGYVQGSDAVTSLSEDDSRNGTERFSQAILQASKTADVLVLLLTKTTFEETVVTQWDELISNVNKSSIWCFGASRNALSSIDLDELRSSVDAVIVYQRVGVARISSEYKKQLLEAVSNAPN